MNFIYKIFASASGFWKANEPPQGIASNEKLLSQLKEPSRQAQTQPTAVPQPRFSFSVTSTEPAAHVSEDEVAQVVSLYSFVLTNELPTLPPADIWWDEDTHARRIRDGSKKAYAWTLPFIPLEIAMLEQLQEAHKRGLHGVNATTKALRTLIRERRKSKQAYIDLLQVLFNACILEDFIDTLKFEGMPPRAIARYVNINELQDIHCDFAKMGYQAFPTLLKTDVKWLVEIFGEPVGHQSFNALWPHIRRNAISRYCWTELSRSNNTAKSLNLPMKSMQEWLNELVKRNIGYRKEWQERVATQHAKMEEQASRLEPLWLAITEPFIVADLETTGLNTETSEILEFAALLVEPSGSVTAEFETLVAVMRPVPETITALTGISQMDVDREGQPLSVAMKSFLNFVGTRPVFFHNAPFDSTFLKKASALTGLQFSNPVYDTLPLARVTWPFLDSHKLVELAEHVGAVAPTHRALADATSTLAVLLAARAKWVL
jgi:DNA polymerase-3 subunit epsilon